MTISWEYGIEGKEGYSGGNTINEANWWERIRNGWVPEIVVVERGDGVSL